MVFDFGGETEFTNSTTFEREQGTSESQREQTVQDTTNQQLNDLIESIKNSLTESGQQSQNVSDITTQAGASEFALPFLEQLLKSGPQAFSQAPQFFPGSTIADPNATERQGEGQLLNRLFGGTDLQRGAEAETLRTLGGVENPFLQDTIRAAQRPTEESFRENVLPQLNANFIGSNRTGSGAADRATQTANRDFTRNIGDIASNISFQSFDAERNRQQGAAQFAPILANQRTNELSQFRDIGRSRTADDQRKIDESVQRFNFGQEAPRADAERLTQLINTITGQLGNQTQRGVQTGDVTSQTQAQETQKQTQSQVIDILRNILENEDIQSQFQRTKETDSTELRNKIEGGFGF